MEIKSSSVLYNNSTEKNNQNLSNSYQMKKKPRLILENIWAFSPNKETLGGTAYLIFNNEGNILVDCPFWDENTLEFCQQQGGVKYLFITHRTAISKQIYKIKENLNCQVIIQEQEAYLLPNIEVISFQEHFQVNSDCQLIWTPGHSPGSSCLYYARLDGVLFSGRHLLPNDKNECVPLRVRKTFHWPRQLKSQAKLEKNVFQDQLKYICPGANTGYLRGKGFFIL